MNNTPINENLSFYKQMFLSKDKVFVDFYNNKRFLSRVETSVSDGTFHKILKIAKNKYPEYYL